MTARRFILVALFLSAKSFGAFSCDPPLRIFFINGVNNTRDAANISRDQLAQFLVSHNFEHPGLRWTPESTKLAYNQTADILSDLLESYIQKYGEETERFWLWIAKMESAPKEFIGMSQKIENRPVPTPDNYNMTTIKSDIDLSVLEHYRVLIIAHSQGNFFGNYAIDSVKEDMWWDDDKLSARLVSIATPSSHVSGDGGYVTISTDNVIKSVPLALKANYTNNKPKTDLLNHDFVDHYLHGDVASAEIMKLIDKESLTLSKVGRGGSASCENWFKNFLSKQKISSRASCLNSCRVEIVGMDTMACGNHCAELCDCEFGDSN